jgi:hypothetical protein
MNKKEERKRLHSATISHGHIFVVLLLADRMGRKNEVSRGDSLPKDDRGVVQLLHGRPFHRRSVSRSACGQVTHPPKASGAHGTNSYHRRLPNGRFYHPPVTFRLA